MKRFSIFLFVLASHSVSAQVSDGLDAASRILGLANDTALLQQRIEQARDLHNEVMGIHRDFREVLDDVQYVDQVLNGGDRTLPSVANKGEALKRLLDKYKSKARTLEERKKELEETREDSDRREMVAEGFVFQSKLEKQSEHTSELGLRQAEKARQANPLDAQKLTAQNTGLMIAALADLQRSNAEMIRLLTVMSSYMAEEREHRVRNELGFVQEELKRAKR